MTSPAHNQEHGFALIELLIALAIGGIVLSAMVSTFISQRKTYAVQEQVTEMVQNARAAMAMLTREIRMAGYNPAGASFDRITYNATQLQIRADLNGNGNANEADERIVYSYDAPQQQIMRDAGAGNQPLVGSIQNFAFTYLDRAGNPTTTTAQIHQIRLVITAKTPKPDPHYPANGGYRTYTLTSLITPRN